MQKNLNKQIGILKRKFKMGKDDFEPGTLISKMKENKSIITSKQPLSKKQVAVRGMV